MPVNIIINTALINKRYHRNYLLNITLHVAKSGRIVAIKYGRMVAVTWPFIGRIVRQNIESVTSIF